MFILSFFNFACLYGSYFCTHKYVIDRILEQTDSTRLTIMVKRGYDFCYVKKVILHRNYFVYILFQSILHKKYKNSISQFSLKYFKGNIHTSVRYIWAINFDFRWTMFFKTLDLANWIHTTLFDLIKLKYYIPKENNKISKYLINIKIQKNAKQT